MLRSFRRRSLLVLTWRSLLAGLAAGPGLGCGETSPGPAGSRANLVWVVIDAARADFLGAYGNALPTTPHIDALAEEATLFERAYSQATWTLPSTASFLSGRYPQASLARGRMAEGQSIAAVLLRAGMRTAAFSENPYVTREHGFDDGFEVFREYFPFATLEDSPRDYPRMESARTLDDVLGWLDDRPTGPFFLYLHLLPPHAPYQPPEPFAGRFDPDYAGEVHGRPATLLDIDAGKQEIEPRDLQHLRLEYQENLAFADHQVGRLVAALEQEGILPDTLLVVSSDHGEAFREHGFLLHNVSLYQEVVHVPLVIRFPDALGIAPGRWPGVVELRQIPATACDVLAVADCPRHGGSLLEVLRDAAPERGLALSFSRSREGDALSGVIGPRHKLVRRGPGKKPLLFDLEADPGETRDVFAANRSEARRLEKHFRERLSQRVETLEQPIDERTREQLRALGYAE